MVRDRGKGVEREIAFPRLLVAAQTTELAAGSLALKSHRRAVLSSLPVTSPGFNFLVLRQLLETFAFLFRAGAHPRAEYGRNEHPSGLSALLSGYPG